ncbi:MAG TPA: hypothetical protein VHA35_20150, partial [Dongiaceae bacterium]|nr:hypothetical protein [Dongiaceae bacterium]
LGCRALGINVLDSDLVDRRGGGARGPRQCGGPAKAPGQEQLGMPVPGPEGELRQILALAKALLARGNGMQAGASIVINVGSPEPSSKARPSVHKNRPKRRK